MSKVLKLQKLSSANRGTGVDAISWSSCDSGSCNKTVRTVIG